MENLLLTAFWCCSLVWKISRSRAEQSGVSTSYVEWNAEKFTWNQPGCGSVFVVYTDPDPAWQKICLDPDSAPVP